MESDTVGVVPWNTACNYQLLQARAAASHAVIVRPCVTGVSCWYSQRHRQQHSGNWGPGAGHFSYREDSA